MILCTFLGVTLNLILCVSLSYPQWLQSLEGVERWECVCVGGVREETSRFL